MNAIIKVRLAKDVVDGTISAEGSVPTYQIVDTTVGRVFFSEILPAGMPFALINTVMTKKVISS